MKKIEIKCEIVTPLVMGGAEMQPELRSQSFNGLFRYWFRLLGGTIEDEKRLFGWGGEKANKGIVKIIVNVKAIDKKSFGEIVNEFQKKFPGKKFLGYNYLGFSLSLTERKLIKSGNFEILLYFHPTSTDEDIKKFLSAVWCAFYLGNFGSRSRRGFGSIMVNKIDGGIPKNFGLSFSPTGNIGDWIKTQLKNIESLKYWQARKDIPYVFENLEIYKLASPENDFISILNKLGNEYKSYRRTKSLMDRIWFGLPIANLRPTINNKSLRRASPLIFKVIKWDNNFDGFILLFKPNKTHNFKFLPDGAQIGISNVNLKNPNWGVLDEFIGDLKNKNLIKQAYP